MAIKKFVLAVLLLGLIMGLRSQTIEAWIESNEKVPVEMIYVQTDRSHYFTGEPLWLKSYLTDSRSGRLIPGAENVYIELTGEAGVPVLKVNLMSINGQAAGQLVFPDTLKPGNYILSAYTDYLQNFGSDSYFKKSLSIIHPSRSLRAIDARQRTGNTVRMVADASFMPEGGKLLEGASNLVAFKAIDKNGYGVDVTGIVKDEAGNDVLTFSSDYKGMGLFFLTPEAEKSYHAVINGFPGFRFSFNDLTDPDGIKIQLVNQTSNDLLINITGNSDRYKDKTLYLVNMKAGNAVFYQPVTIEEKNQLLRFNHNILKGGVNQLVLLDNEFQPVSERLIFSEMVHTKELNIVADKKIYTPRSEVNISVSEDGNTEEVSNLSVAVVHEAAFKDQNSASDILSWLLISSELNGFIESPHDYFSDSIIPARTKQQLLMLTNGWTSYFWNSVPKTGTTLDYPQKVGLELHGTATNANTGDVLKNGEIMLMIEKDGEMAVLTQKSDNEGRFSFSGLLFNDTASIYIQAKTQKRRQNTVVTLLQNQVSSAPETYIKSLNNISPFPAELDIMNYHQRVELEKFQRRSGAIPQNQTAREIPAARDGHFRIYERADQVIDITEKDANYSNIIDFLTGKVAGLDVNGDEVTIRGAGNFSGVSTPLFLIDGIPLSSIPSVELPGQDEITTSPGVSDVSSSPVHKVKAIPMGDIDKVEILKTPQNLALFGVEGSNGVIAIYTQKGVQTETEITKGFLEKKIAGYSSYRKFYAPQYLPEIESSEAPEYRTTLHWEPELLLNNGQANFSFYTSDQPGLYKITIEGISESGMICYGTGWMEVK